MIIDTHLHLWDPQRLRYPWLAELPALQERFDLARLGRPAEVAGAVVVQADCVEADALAEIDYVLEQSALPGALPILGMVAFAPLERPDALARYLARFAATPLVVGVRRLFHDEEPGFFCSRALAAGVDAVTAAGLTVEVTVRQRQLPELINWVRGRPHARFVLDHFGKPEVGAPHRFTPWRDAMIALAEFPNVMIKLSGLGAEAVPSLPLAPQARPFLDAALEIFGPARCLIGSDWPVSTSRPDAGWGYRDWLDQVSAALDDLDDADRRRVEHGNAERVYGVRVPGQRPSPAEAS